MKRAVKDHFRAVDPILSGLLDRVGTIIIEKSNDAFSDLVESIICQQLSDKAGMTICTRFKREPTVKQMEKLSHQWKPYRTYAARILWRSLEI